MSIKIILTILLSTVICGFVSFISWLLIGNSNEIKYLSDFFFLSGVIFFVIGMIVALFATSRWHYYRHLKKKWNGKEQGNEFDNGAQKRKSQALFGAAIALSGIIGFAVSGYIAVKFGY